MTDEAEGLKNALGQSVPLSDGLDTPRRVVLSRKKGWKMPSGTVKVSRPSKWGNPFAVDKYGRAKAVEMFHNYIGHQNSPLGFEPEDIEQLRGKNLACWCKLDEMCHADVLLAIANAEIRGGEAVPLD